MSGHEPAPSKTTLWAGAALYFVAAAAIVIAVAGGVYQLRLSSQLTDLAEVNRANSTLLVQCTTPPEARTPPVKIDADDVVSDCYARSQAATGRAVEDIGTISIAAAACGAANPGDVTATEACVKQTLAARR